MAVQNSEYPMGNPMYNNSSSSSGTGNADNYWNQGWNEGFNNPTKAASYYFGNQDQNWASGYAAGVAEYNKRNSGSVLGSQNTPTGGSPTGGQPSGGTPTNNGPSEEQLLQEQYGLIDQESQNSFNFLDTQENTLRANQPGVEQSINAQSNTLKGSALSNKEDAQTNARRLYSELIKGSGQRFGGASSAGEAARSLYGVEQQRTMAQNEKTYQSAVAQVELSASEAIRSAQSEFQNQLLEISRNRTTVEGEKLAARRQALSELSTKVYNIQQQKVEFERNLTLMQKEYDLQNSQNIKSLNSTNISNNVTPQTNYRIGATQQTGNGIDNATGYIKPWMGYEDKNKQQSFAY